VKLIVEIQNIHGVNTTSRPAGDEQGAGAAALFRRSIPRSRRRLVPTRLLICFWKGQAPTATRRKTGHIRKQLKIGSPSWIRIEPCALRRSLLFGGFSKTFELLASLPD
jgi:hypothetical protein